MPTAKKNNEDEEPPTEVEPLLFSDEDDEANPGQHPFRIYSDFPIMAAGDEEKNNGGYRDNFDEEGGFRDEEEEDSDDGAGTTSSEELVRSDRRHGNRRRQQQQPRNGGRRPQRRPPPRRRDDYQPIGFEQHPAPRRSSRCSGCCCRFLVLLTMIAAALAGLYVFDQKYHDGGSDSFGELLENLENDTLNLFSPEGVATGAIDNDISSGDATSRDDDVDIGEAMVDKINENYDGASSPTGGATTTSTVAFDRDALNTLLEDNQVPKQSSTPKHKVHYDPTGLLQAVNPFDFTMPNSYGSNVLAPPLLFQQPDDDSSGSMMYYEDEPFMQQEYLGYFKDPNIVNNTLVFCAEGDVFVTSLNGEDNSGQIMPATKLTTTIGNVLNPKLHPSKRYLAYTATYSGRRDLYLMDLAGPRSSAMRLTYWDVSYGVSGLIGWVGNSLLFRAMSNEVSLRDYRLYLLNLDNRLFPPTSGDDGDDTTDDDDKRIVLGIDPVPLSQAMEGVLLHDCWYFVRVKQSSNTIRYVGGTAEQLWKHCPDMDHAEKLFRNDGYNGTSKSPQIHTTADGNDFLFFLSDRGRKDGSWIPDRMNVWAMDLSNPSNDGSNLIQITDTSCDFEGRIMQEYTIDHVTGNLIVRIGADLYVQPLDDTRRKLEAGIAEAKSLNSMRWLKGDKDKNGNGDNNNKKNNNNGKSNNNKKDNSNNNNNGNENNKNKNKNNKNNNGNNGKNKNNNNNNKDGNGGNTNVPSPAPSASPSNRPSSQPSSFPSSNPSQFPTTPPTSNIADGDEDGDGNGGVGEDGNGAGDSDGHVVDEDGVAPAIEDGDGITGGDVAEDSDGVSATEDGDGIIDGDFEDGDGMTVEDGDVESTTEDEDGGDFEDVDGTAFDGSAEDGDGIIDGMIEHGDGSENEEENSETDTDSTSSPSVFPSSSPSAFPSSNPSSTDEINTDGAISDNGDNEDIEDITESSSDLNQTDSNQTEPEGTAVYYDYETPELESRIYKEYVDHHSGSSADLSRLPIQVYSDFSAHQERLIPVSMMKHLTSADVYETTTGATSFLMTLRGQLWVAPVIDDGPPEYEGSGMNIPHRQYRVAPGATMGGVVRILKSLHVPNPVEDDTSDRRLALILATDPLSKTAEHAFYLIETQRGINPVFLNFDQLPRPFVGGHVSGGATTAGGLGSVYPNTVTVSPCGRRMAWSDTDGRILVMNLPQYQHMDEQEPAQYVVLPKENELGESMIGDEVELSFSPGGRYLAIEHNARNQFTIISIADLGDAEGDDEVSSIVIGRIVQATPSRFNSESMYWGKSTMDIHALKRNSAIAAVLGEDDPDDVATTLYFLSDRDIHSDVGSPWGTRQPMPHFDKLRKAVYALPFQPRNSTEESEGRFSGGGASEMQVDAVLERKNMLTTLRKALKGRRLAQAVDSALAGVHGIADASYGSKRGVGDRTLVSEDVNNSTTNSTLRLATFPKDMDIDFGPVDLSFARNAYRLSRIPEGDYHDIVCQTSDDGSIVLVAEDEKDIVLKVFLVSSYPSDDITEKTLDVKIRKLVSWGLSTSRNHFYLGFFPDGAYKVVENTKEGLVSMILDGDLDEDVVDSEDLFLSVWPSLENQQMYSDAWRMLRDYFYDKEMTQIDWPVVHDRYLPLVSRCTKREELDDVLQQMASELSALHVFVYGGEYNSPVTDRKHKKANEVASLGAGLQRSPEWKGYKVVSIPERDPDFSIIDGGETPIYSPLSDRHLQLSGQKGLEVGDVIVGVNGESVMRVPDIHMLLRGTAGRSVRLDVLRLASGDEENDPAEATPEPLITVPLDPDDYDDLLYSAWEYNTQVAAEKLAAENGFSVGYVHLRDMSGSSGAFDAFARGFFPNYNKDAFILDVRHNHGGSMDSWVLDILQRQAFYYWQSRDFNPTNGGLGWDEQFAFRGHIIVLIDEKTSSDGEGVSRGISELGIGRLVGTRTWGGGIWLSSDNHLVDGGIATAPEVGTYNDKWGWGMGIEMTGVEPDIEVDNDPHSAFKGSDLQLERAISELKVWLEQEPVVIPQPPPHKKDVTMGSRECTA